MTDRLFHIGDILSVTTGRLVSRRHMAGVHDLLKHLTGDPLFTHQLGRAMDAAIPWLLQQHPQLAEVAPAGPLPARSAEEWLAWPEQIADELGLERTLPVAPLPAGDYEPRNPVQELAEQLGRPAVL